MINSYELEEGIIHLLEAEELSSHQLNPDCSCHPSSELSSPDPAASSAEHFTGIIWTHYPLTDLERWDNEGGTP